MNVSAIPAILKEGMMVGVRVGSNAHWHGNVIYEAGDSVIRIAYLDKFMKGIAEPGCPVWIKFSNDYFIYYFNGIIESVSFKLPANVSVKLHSAEEMINNRLFPRYDVRLEAVIKPLWDNEAYDCIVTDLSYGGAAFICKHKFERNENIEILLKLTDDNTVTLTGKVVRRRNFDSNDSDHAAQFIECDNNCSRQLTEFFTQLEENFSGIYLQYISELRKRQ